MSLSIPTAAQLYAAARAEAQARQPSLTDWSEGSALDALTGAGVILADQSIRIGLDALAARMVATATGSDLDAAVTDRYPALTRRAASSAVATLTLTRGGSTGALSIPAGTLARATVNGVQITFATDDDATMDAAGDTVDVIATCTATGTSGNVGAGLITTLPTALAGDVTATVTNSARAVGGAAAESDDAYRARAQAYPLTLTRGTVSALESGALTVPGVAHVTVDESLIAADDCVYVYVGDPDGRGNAALSAAVAAVIEDYRAAGVLVTVLPAEREDVDLTVVVSVRQGRTTDALAAACRAAVIAYADGLAPSQRLYFSAVEAACIAVSTDVLGAQASSTAGTGQYLSVSEPQNALRTTVAGLTLTLLAVS